jgi:histidinol-phosphate aminotransferase
MPDISYSFYPVYCKLFAIDYREKPLNREFEIDLDAYSEQNGGVVFANPNAPTGIAVDLESIASFLSRNTKSVVVVDEAYVDFGADSAVQLINQFDNLVVTQTLSKSRSLAGLRVGFAFANEKLIEALERVKNSFHPYALGSLALAGAQAAIEDHDYFDQTRKKVISTRERVAGSLRELKFEVFPSKANFLFVRHSHISSETLFHKLREQRIITRYFKQPRIDAFLRISIGNDSEMDRLITAIESLI